jgi:biotin synthase
MTRWKLSAGTACVIGKQKSKTDALPTTAYIMLGEGCQNHCKFCAQSQDSEARADLLSRVTWPAFSDQEAVSAIAGAHLDGQVRRACLQVVQNPDSREATMKALQLLRSQSAIPVCVSSHIETVEQARELVAGGAERICIALDAATPAIYKQVKGSDWHDRWLLLQECAQQLPGRVTTHLIVGLGETETEMVEVMAACIQQGITVGLFAFTPVRGTVWSERLPPPIEQYRRLQIAHCLLKGGYGREAIICCQGRIAGFKVEEEGLQTLLADGSAFQTSGCDDCNRPYYNERPGGVMYNYPRQLTAAEVVQAIAECGIMGGISHELASG